MNEPSLLERVEKLERAVREIHRTRWDIEYPPGHAEREAMMPKILREKETKTRSQNESVTNRHVSPRKAYQQEAETSGGVHIYCAWQVSRYWSTGFDVHGLRS